ncbi:hypothetical protein [Candidatus Spongiihabitans sp.]
MASQRAFVLSIHHYPPTRHCPAHIIIGRAIQLNICHAQRDSLFPRLRRK